MKTKQNRKCFYLAIGTLCLAASVSCTDLEKMTPPCEYVHSEVQTCVYPLAPEDLDGDLDSDRVWQAEEIHWEKVTYDMVGQVPSGTQINAASGNMDASFEFACIADNENMYFGFRIIDDEIKAGESKNECVNIFNDDSIEILLDQCTRGCPDNYNGDGAQLMIAAENLYESSDVIRCENVPNIRGTPTPVKVYVKKIDGSGWNAEIVVPLKPQVGGDRNWWNIVPTPGRVIGFQTVYNDDDNDDTDTENAERDHQLLWGKKDRNEVYQQSWMNPMYLEKLMFCPREKMGADVDDSAIWFPLL